MMEAIIVFFCLGLIIGIISGYAIGFYSTKNENKTHQDMIRKDVLLKWVKSEMEKLWELLPDADNPNPTQMELRYLGQYMQMEALEDKLNLM